MERIKKISWILVLVLVLSINFLPETYAKISCKTSMTCSAEVKQGEELEVTIGVANIQGDNGVIIFGGTVEYDKNVLTYIGKSGEGNWSVSYNNSNGKFVADRDEGFATSNETVLKLKFKVNDNATGSTTIAVKNAAVSDAKEDKDTGGASKTISIKAKETDKDNNQNQGGNSNQGGSQGSNQGSKPNTSTSGNKKPTTNKVTETSTAPKDESNTENTNNMTNGIDENVLDEENTITNEVNIFDNEEELVKEETKSDDKIKNTLTICVICLIIILVIISIAIFVKRRKMRE